MNMTDVFTFPSGCHVAEVEIDPETGAASLVRYTAVDDYGRLINPLLTEGQVQGGVAQGIGQAMLEHTVYDPESGQLLSGSFMDYAMPRADDLPSFDIALVERPTAGQSARRQGLGPGGLHLRAADRDGCRARCAQARGRSGDRHAGDAGEDLESDCRAPSPRVGSVELHGRRTTVVLGDIPERCPSRAAGASGRCRHVWPLPRARRGSCRR